MFTVIADKLSAGGRQKGAEGLLAEYEQVYNVPGSLRLGYCVLP